MKRLSEQAVEGLAGVRRDVTLPDLPEPRAAAERRQGLPLGHQVVAYPVDPDVYPTIAATAVSWHVDEETGARHITALRIEGLEGL